MINDPPEGHPEPPIVDEKKLKQEKRKKEINWLRAYYHVGYPEASAKRAKMTAEEITAIGNKVKSGEVSEFPECPKCGGEMAKRISSFGHFWSCVKYPRCDGKRSIKSNVNTITPEQKEHTRKKLDIVLNYIQEIGGIDDARRWLGIAIQTLTKED